MARPEIVAYQLQDQSEVEAFFASVWRLSRFPFDPEGAHSDVRGIPTVYQFNGGGFWLIRFSQIVGTVAIRRLSENIAEVKRLNVTEAHRGRGLGSRLL